MDLRERSGGGRHPWEVARAQFVLGVLARSGALERTERVLDVGAGDAWLAGRLCARLPRLKQAVCWDSHYSDQDLQTLGAAAPGLELTRTRPSGRFDLALLLDVLEHVEDDRGFLRALVEENLAPGALALVTVPAWQSLFSRHDVALHHHRRYAPAQCLELISSAGLEVRQSGGLFFSLLPLRAAQIARERLQAPPPDDAPAPESLRWSGGPLVSRALTTVLTADAAVAGLLGRVRLHLPGLSFWALCARPA